MDPLPSISKEREEGKQEKRGGGRRRLSIVVPCPPLSRRFHLVQISYLFPPVQELRQPHRCFGEEKSGNKSSNSSSSSSSKRERRERGCRF